MKRGTPSFLGLLVLVLTFETASACIINNNDQIAIVFPNGSGIDMAALEKYCSEKSCVTVSNNIGEPEYKEINFKVLHAKHEILIIARKSKESNKSETYSLSLKFMDKYPESEELTSLALKLLATNNIIYGLSLNDIKEISNASRIGNLLYFKPAGCGNSFIQMSSKNDEYEKGWLNAARNCNVQEFNGTCPMIGCYECAMATPLENLNLLELPLINSTVENFEEYIPEENENISIERKTSTNIFWTALLIIIALLIVILILALPRIREMIS
ncbi:hypothetical protein A3K73_08705 [Candidatus Pacearchaeota archaeon RBG_13_36_9]|nr:MAG: hypothetical protein A3K73_08705 [Candidatus Pacearchaeota archaeon RBG_13_36_9]